MRTTLIGALLLASMVAIAQPSPHQTENGIRDQREGWFAVQGADIFLDADTILRNATLILRDGKVVKIKQDAAVPDGATALDYTGTTIYPAFIELDSSYGLPDVAPPKPFSFNQAEILSTTNRGPYGVNQAIQSHYRAVQHVAHSAKSADVLRKNGFAAALTHRKDGIARGTGALVLLRDGEIRDTLLIDDASTHYSLNKGSSPQSYPFSVMGAVALLRQTELDAQWYKRSSAVAGVDLSLASWNLRADLPRFFHAKNWLDSLIAKNLAEEQGKPYIIRGAGDEYQRAQQVAKAAAAFVLPLDFPAAQLHSDPYTAWETNLAELMHWELAPTNPAKLTEAGATIALTSSGVEKSFLKQLRKAVRAGLSERDAIAALTSTPAKLLGQEGSVGSLRPKRWANFVVADGNLFGKDARILETWVAGERHQYAAQRKDLRGTYALVLDSEPLGSLTIAGTAAKPKIAKWNDGELEKGRLTFEDDYVTLNFSHPSKGPLQLGGWVDGNTWEGRSRTSDGLWLDWSATQSAAHVEPSKPEKPETQPDGAPADVLYPFVAFGNTTQPEAIDLVFRNVTAWTNEPDGIIDTTDVLIRDGKIASVGVDLPAQGAREVDGSGKHLTPGIIDEHSHIALRSVNDIETNSSMVRMADAIDPESTNIYRNLAGGVTAAQLLHGSANPIGGQSALVKLRWGSLPEEMLIDGADGFIKFALGENVKRSTNSASIRYPQTRMGVEQVYVDAFTRAKAYAEGRKSSTFRRDLSLEPLAEILANERFITAHSYVQSEITMLMDIADRFGFRVNTFTHILEGYKVADAMTEHGAGASTFADWWNYKWEVRYAIPYNAALMQQAGVVVAINSDSTEMSRRLNQEAAKAVKYGGMSEEDAFKLVSLNPAKLLHLDDRMGSLKPGKDGDVVLWDTNPLSIEARAMMTLVDGVVYFDREQDTAKREWVAKERSRLIAKMAADPEAKPAGSKGSPPKPEFACDSLTGFETLGMEVTQ